MAQGRVQVNNLNLGQGQFPEIERTLLFLGTSPKADSHNTVFMVNTDTDFDVEFGEANSPLKWQLETAKVNAGQNWQAFAMPLAALTDPYATDPDDADALPEITHQYLAAIDAAMETASPEGIVVCAPMADERSIKAISAKLHEIRATHGRFLFALVALPGIKAEATWAEYAAGIASLLDGIAANMVCAVPLLHGNDIGVLAGRLCNREVSIADTPMRVATGPVLSLGPTPTDENGVALPSATLTALDAARASCIQCYPDYPGTYFGDANMLEVPTGDYKVIEHARVVLKAMRAVRLLAIFRIGNRLLNSTPASITSHETYFGRPLREMSHAVQYAGYTFPGEIEPPAEDAVKIVWKSRTLVEIYLKLKPYNCPKQIVANIALDLSNDSNQ